MLLNGSGLAQDAGGVALTLSSTVASRKISMVQSCFWCDGALSVDNQGVFVDVSADGGLATPAIVTLQLATNGACKSVPVVFLWF